MPERQTALKLAGAEVSGLRPGTQEFLSKFGSSVQQCEQIKASCRAARAPYSQSVEHHAQHQAAQAVQGALCVSEFCHSITAPGSIQAGDSSPVKEAIAFEGPAFEALRKKAIDSEGRPTTPRALKHLSLAYGKPDNVAAASASEPHTESTGLTETPPTSTTGAQVSSQPTPFMAVNSHDSAGSLMEDEDPVDPWKRDSVVSDEDEDEDDPMSPYSDFGMDRLKGSRSEDKDDAIPVLPPVSARARAPLVRFKMCYQFSKQFESEETKRKAMAVHSATKNMEMKNEVSHKGEESTLTDPVIAWVNNAFAMTLKTEYQLNVSFPIIVLTIMDVIYVHRVPWHKIDWRFQYARALAHNYSLLEVLWRDLNMDKAREFRYIALQANQETQVGGLEKAVPEVKIEFVKRLRHWFDARMRGSEYNALNKRLEIVQLCCLRGFQVRFPPWIHSPPSVSENCRKSIVSKLNKRQPEYLNLIAFLGSPDMQNMYQ